MTAVNLTLAQNQQLARELKRLLEPFTSIKNFVSIDGINSKLTGVQFENKEQIQTVLATNYTPETITPLIETIRLPIMQAIFDCSICNLDNATLKNIFYNNSRKNVVLSPTFDELLALSQKKITSETDTNTKTSVYNANFLIKSILEDKNSDYCTTVMLNSSKKYVDTILLDYCQQTNSELLTCDYRMALRGKLRNIAVTAFHNISSPAKKYHPSKNGKNIFLDKSILTNISLNDLINLAEKEKADKFVISNEFIEALEINKYEVDYIHFFLLDTNNEYTIFKNETKEYTLENIFEDTNAIAYVANTRSCLSYRSIGVEYLLLNEEFKENTEEIISSQNFNYVSSNSNFDNTLLKKEIAHVNSKSPLFPYLTKNHSINTSKIGVNELVWVIDKAGNEVKSNKSLALMPGYTIIHGTNTLKDDKFILNIYSVSASFNLMYKESCNFTSNSFSSVNKNYKNYAEILVLLKKST